tara:strand:- start:156 stop:908 length:753 start_codon:yes stop_codon:yes gene_type:complete
MDNIEIKIYPVNKTAETLMKLYPPVLANKFLPEWYKKQDSYKRGNINTSSIFEAWGQRQAKKCPAIQEIVTQGIVIPAWTDVYIIKNGSYWDWSVGQEVYPNENEGDIGYHNTHQIEGMDLNVIPGYGILKFMSPYSFVTPKGYGLEFQDPFYHIRRDIKILPGKVETDIWHTANFLFEFYKDLDKEKREHIFIKAGEPLLICNVYKKEKNKIDLQLQNYDNKHQEIIDAQSIESKSMSQSWVDYKDNKK